MFDTFRKYLEDKIALTDQDYELIESVSSFRKLRKRQYLLQEGDVCRFNAFVCGGFLRYYYVDEKGQEHIMQFAPENYWTGDRGNGATAVTAAEAAEADIIFLALPWIQVKTLTIVQPFVQGQDRTFTFGIPANL